jgi:glyoxylase-like metal-dependent hydrolase (beta-lactamase superfamily II)
MAETSPDLPESVHVFPLEVEFGGREMTLYPSGIETERGLLLLDAGLPETVPQLEERLEASGFGFEDVAVALLTHQDGDHVGGLSTLVDRANPFVVANAQDAPVIDGRELPRGPDDGDRYPPVRVDLELRDAATFATRAGPARVVPTPGHTPGHVSIYLPEAKFLVAADALTADSNGLAGPRPEMTEDMDEAIASIARLGELDIDATLCYHGGYVAAGSDRIREISDE